MFPLPYGLPASRDCPVKLRGTCIMRWFRTLGRASVPILIPRHTQTEAPAAYQALAMLVMSACRGHHREIAIWMLKSGQMG